MWFVEVSTSGRFLRAACDGPDFPQIHQLLARGCDLGRDRRAAERARKSAGERQRGLHSALQGWWNPASMHQPAQMRGASRHHPPLAVTTPWVNQQMHGERQKKKKDVISHERPLLNDCLQGERWKRSRLLQRRHRGLCCVASSALLLIRAHPSQCFYSLVFHTPLKAHILCWLSQCFVSYIFQAEFSACCLSC